MEAQRKLAEYRARKRREEYVDKANQTLKSFFTFNRKQMTTPDVDESRITDDGPLIFEVSDDENEDLENCTTTWSYIKIITYFLYFILWGTIFLIFVKLQFGIVYVITSALVGIYLNTRTSPKKKNEVSAYSVFNKDCKSIDGTLKAEQFEKEIRFGAVAVH